MSKEKIVVVSGGFDPVHSGHISYFESASLLGDKLIVALNSDEWLIKKKKKFFMPFNERKNIIENLKMIDEVIGFKDDDLGSCIDALVKIKNLNSNKEIIFCNGGDRTQSNIPEMIVDNINFVFGVGGKTKKNSSSWILKDYSYDSVEKVWGKYYNLFVDDKVKLKELVLLPGKGISYQRHFFRNEFWFVSKGECIVKFSQDVPNSYKETLLKSEDFFHIKKGAWHQISNQSKKPCHIIEIQYGDKTIEEDIERISYYEI
jgi:cytidyltransferase-like protein